MVISLFICYLLASMSILWIIIFTIKYNKLRTYLGKAIGDLLLRMNGIEDLRAQINVIGGKQDKQNEINDDMIYRSSETQKIINAFDSDFYKIKNSVASIDKRLTNLIKRGRR